MKLKPKILFLLHLPPPVHGSSVVGLSIKESKIINDSLNGTYINLLASHNVAESGTVNSKKLISFAITWFHVLASIIKNRPKLCYFALTVKGVAFYKDLLLVFLLKIFRIKIVYHLHNKGIKLHQNKFLYKLGYKFVFKKSNVILISDYLYPDIQSFVPKTNVYLCSNGIKDIGKNSNGSLGNMISGNPAIDKPVQVLFLSNLLESKGVFVLLEACSILKSRNISFECTFIGGIGDISAKRFQCYVDMLGINDIVFYKGEKYGEEKNKVYAAADIFVFPTLFETFGLVNLEAMQHSKPVISTMEGGIPDIIDDGVTGFLVPPNDVETLAKRMELLIKNNNLCIQMGVAGRKKYEQQFTQEIFENRLNEIIVTLVQNNN
jgi:glycosyltransferase involved in cell wall biosynthesis